METNVAAFCDQKLGRRYCITTTAHGDPYPLTESLLSLKLN